MDNVPYVEVRVMQRFAASPERVYDAWLDPAIAGEWMFATASRRMDRVTMDARAGGLFRFEERRRGQDVVQAGQYLELDRPRCLVFTLSMSEHSRHPARVSVGIVPLEAGCELTLVHENVLPDRASFIGARWEGMLYGLATLLDSGAARGHRA